MTCIDQAMAKTMGASKITLIWLTAVKDQWYLAADNNQWQDRVMWKSLLHSPTLVNYINFVILFLLHF